MMHGYKGFSSDVKRIFKDLLDRYSLKLVEENDYMAVFESAKCLLRICTEYTYAEIHFKQNKDEKWMVLGPYLKALYPDAKIRFTDTSQQPRKEAILSSLSDLSNILQEYGKPFLSGDFSWQDEYEKFN